MAPCACRCRSDAVREAMARRVRAQVAAICERRGLRCSVETRHDAPAAACHPDIIAGLISACRDAEEVPLPLLVIVAGALVSRRCRGSRLSHAAPLCTGSICIGTCGGTVRSGMLSRYGGNGLHAEELCGPACCRDTVATACMRTCR